MTRRGCRSLLTRTMAPSHRRLHPPLVFARVNPQEARSISSPLLAAPPSATGPHEPTGGTCSPSRSALFHICDLPSPIMPRTKPAKRNKEDDVFGAQFDDILESMTHSSRRSSKQLKKRGRKKGSRKNVNPEVTRKLGDATLHYASGQYEEASHLLEEVVRVAPNLADAYHTLGLIYTDMGEKEKAMSFYMIAAHLTPKDPSLWNILVAWSMKHYIMLPEHCNMLEC